MTFNAALQIFVFITVLILLAKPLGLYIAHVYELKPFGIFQPIENTIYRCCGVDPNREMDWKSYTIALLLFNFIGLLLGYTIERLQFSLPLNPQGFSGVSPVLAFNTIASFVTNTNWQAYSGETTMSNLTHMLVMTVQNFVSAASGMAVMAALIRGIARHETTNLGNFWVDLIRGTLYVLVPLASILAILLLSQGVVQTFKSDIKVNLVEPVTYTAVAQKSDKVVTKQILPVGPAASQIAIKQLGTNGGGFFGVNSAHPFENPTPLSNFLEMLAILLIPAALCFTFGKMVKDKRQGRAMFLIITLIFVPLLIATVYAEQKGNPILQAIPGIDANYHVGTYTAPGGNMEGKELRFGVVNSGMWAAATTAASNGSVNSMLDSFTPIGGMIPMLLMQLGEVVYGGVGSGLCDLLLFILLTVFIAGLMVGRTPEYLGKKIEVFEMKMTCLAVLIMPIAVLLGTAVAVMTEAGRASVFNSGAHGFSEVLYAFSSTGNNNGSSFAGLNANTNFYNIATGFAMLFGRFWLAVPILAIAGALARKKLVPISSGTLPTHTPLFIVLVIGIILIVGALTFLPALALGPIVEHLMMIGF